jgi:formiminotetrahydrofolate cyclodeaminase
MTDSGGDRDHISTAGGGLGADGAGAGAARVVAGAAGMIRDAAGASGEWRESPGIKAQAAALERKGERLARENAAAYRAARTALGEPAGGSGQREQEIADMKLGEALARAADLPLAIAEAAVDAAELGAVTAERGRAEVRADAAGAAALAAGAAVAAGHLVEINLATRAGDERVGRARELVELARSAGERALTASA